MRKKRFDMNHPIDLDPVSNRRADPHTNARVDSRYRYKYPQFVAGERTGGKVRKKLKLPPEAPDAPEAPVPPVKHHHSRKAEKKRKCATEPPARSSKFRDVLAVRAGVALLPAKCFFRR
jgi:hypothetical protein